MKKEFIKEDRFEYRKVFKERVVKSGKEKSKKREIKKSKFYEDFQEDDEYHETLIKF